VTVSSYSFDSLLEDKITSATEGIEGNVAVRGITGNKRRRNDEKPHLFIEVKKRKR
jgi:hypothetical protein